MQTLTSKDFDTGKQPETENSRRVFIKGVGLVSHARSVW